MNKDLDKSIEKKFKKYILEVDDAIESHGFKLASYIDYAEDNILKLQNSTKNHYKNYGSSILFTNLLENSLDTIANDIVNYTITEATDRNVFYSPEKLNNKAINLHQDLKFLNERLLNSFKTLD